ncbi:hypothetical protein R3P38DRAFT_3349514 [Favolaschia claudopus]|uniref:F-box domain-containing protein n=1 Tax=Favolaschia claudopus TaxID=2862362 RepID=A0AAW0CJT0_9AGAR
MNVQAKALPQPSPGHGNSPCATWSIDNSAKMRLERRSRRFKLNHQDAAHRSPNFAASSPEAPEEKARCKEVMLQLHFAVMLEGSGPDLQQDWRTCFREWNTENSTQACFKLIVDMCRPQKSSESGLCWDASASSLRVLEQHDGESPQGVPTHCFRLNSTSIHFTANVVRIVQFCLAQSLTPGLDLLHPEARMSIEEIEARISKLTADIELQTEVLRQLHQLKSAAQRELNDIRDPFPRLPPELLYQIFQYCRPDGPPKPDPRAVPMLLLNVCHRWVDMALSLPDLWAAIYVDLPHVHIMEGWLHRAGRHLLSIDLRTDLSSELVLIMRQFANQIRYLSLHQEQLSANTFAIGLLPNLEAMKIGFLKSDFDPSQGFTEHDTLNWNLYSYCPSAILKLLRLAPNLQECVFDQGVSTDENDEDDEEENDGGLFPNLRTLKLGSPQSGSYGCSNKMLRHLTLPSLQTLHLTFSTTVISPVDLSSFLQRSSPPLHTLILAYDSQTANFTDCLRLVPSLEHLKLYVNHWHREPSFLDVPPSTLSDSTLHLLPNLGTLEIEAQCRYNAERCYAAFLHLLFSRRSKLARASLILSGWDDPEPGPVVYAGLQELAASGMDIQMRGSAWVQWFPLR